MTATVAPAAQLTAAALWAQVGRQPMAYPTPMQLVQFLRLAPDHLAARTAARYIDAMQDAAHCAERHDHRRRA